MDSLLAKIFFSFPFILSLINGTSYIQVSSTDLTFNFKTGDNFPIIQTLGVTNTGPERARFDISSNVSWIFTYREFQSSASSIELPSGSSVNFILEIRAEQAPDGANSEEVKINAVSLFDSSLLESKTVNVALNKNVVAETPSAGGTPTQSPTSTPTLTPSPTGEPTPQETITPTRTPTTPSVPAETISPTPIITQAPPLLPLQLSPTISPSPSPEPTPARTPALLRPFRAIFNFFLRLF